MIIVDLRYYLSKDNNINKFGPPVRQIWSFENGRSSPFWPTFPKIAGRRTKTVGPMGLKIEMSASITLYTKYESI